MKKIIRMYSKKQNEVYLIYVIAFLILLAFYLLVVGKLARESIMVGVIALCFVSEYKKANRHKKQELNIIENGEVFEGKVLRVEEEIYFSGRSAQVIRKLLVEFLEGSTKKFIMTNDFPYPISIQKEENTTETNLMEFTQYYRNNCISFEKGGKGSKKFTYKGTVDSNFEGELTCKVYKYKDKYIVDDFEGYEKIKKTEYNILGVVLITIMLLVLAGYIYGVFFQS